MEHTSHDHEASHVPAPQEHYDQPQNDPVALVGASDSYLSYIAKAFLISLFAFLPIVFLPLSWAAIPHAKIMFVAILTALAVLVWTGIQVRKKDIAIPKSGILAAAALLPIAYLISALFTGGVSSFSGTGLERDTVVAMFLWFSALAAVALLFTSSRDIVRGYQAILVGAGILGLLQLLRIVFGPEFLSFEGALLGPAASLVGSWHDLGIFLGLIALLCAALMGTNFSSGMAKWLPITILPLSLILLIIVNPTDVWIALAVLSVASAGYLFLLRKNDVEHAFQWNTPLTVLAALFVISSTFALFGTAVHERLPESLQIVQLEVRPSWEGTFSVGSAVFKQNPLFGSGPNTFEKQWGLYKPTGVNETLFWDANFNQGVGFIPTSIITVGIIGALAWALFFLVLLYRGARSLWSSHVQTRWRLLMFALFSGSLYLWVMHVIYPPGIMLLALAFLLTGLFVAAQRASGAVSTAQVGFRVSPRIGFTAMVLILSFGLVTAASAWSLSRSTWSDLIVNRSIVVFNTTGDFEATEAELQKALSLNANNTRALRALAELDLVRFVQLANEGIETEEQGEALQLAIARSIQTGLSAVSANSTDYQNWLALARAYEQLVGAEVEGAYENAEAAYVRAIEENPTSPVPFLQLARLAVARNDIGLAREHLSESLQRKSNYAPAHFLLSQIESSEGNLEAAILSAQSTVASAPEEPLAWFQLGALEYSAENYEDAGVALEQAVALDANYANALFVLGLIYAQLDFTDDAISVFERIAVLNPDNEEVPQIIASLKAGEHVLEEELGDTEGLLGEETSEGSE